MPLAADNPYAPPAAPTAGTDPTVVSASDPWKQVARRWELLRLPFNLIVGLCGLVVLWQLSRHPLPWGTLELVLVYGVAANGCYLIGPLGEMYLNWLADVLAERGWLLLLVRLVRSEHTTMALFLVGLLCSVALTFAIGAAAAFTLPTPN